MSTEEKLAEALELLHSCLEWDNGGEREYEKIVAFLNQSLNYGSKKEDKHFLFSFLKSDIEKTTTFLCRRYDLIVVEDLHVAGMMKNRRLAKSLSDAAFGGIGVALERKSLRFGTKIVKVGRFFPSSKQCRLCGVKNQDLTLGDRVFQCLNPTCGHQEDRDHHAAKGLHSEGLRLLPRAAGEVTSVEFQSIPPWPSGSGGKPRRRSRKRPLRSGASSNAEERQKSNPPDRPFDHCGGVIAHYKNLEATSIKPSGQHQLLIKAWVGCDSYDSFKAMTTTSSDPKKGV